MNKIDYIHKDTKTNEPLITAIELSKENIKFYGNTEEEKNKNEMIYDLILEVDRLNNIINRMEEDLKEMYMTFGKFNEEYTEKQIQKLKEGK